MSSARSQEVVVKKFTCISTQWKQTIEKGNLKGNAHYIAGKMIPKFMWQYKGPKITKIILEKKNITNKYMTSRLTRLQEHMA